RLLQLGWLGDEEYRTHQRRPREAPASGRELQHPQLGQSLGIRQHQHDRNQLRADQFLPRGAPRAVGCEGHVLTNSSPLNCRRRPLSARLGWRLENRKEIRFSISFLLQTTAEWFILTSGPKSRVKSK